MPSASKDLSALGSVLELVVDSAYSGRISSFGNFHYKSGTGSIILEGTNDVDGNAIWFTLVDEAGVDIVVIVAAGVTIFPIHGYARIRARNTVAGVGNLVSLAFQ